jgi:GntR family transcriptional regulator
MVEFDLKALPKLEAQSFTPLYVQLADRLAEHIRVRRLPADTLLPSEAECMAHFGVSRLTVRLAMAKLVSLGLVHRARGRGTFVAAPRIDHKFGASFEEDMIETQVPIRFKLLTWREVAAPEEVALALNLKPGATAFKIERLRFADDKSIGIEIRFIPAALGARLRVEDLHQRPVYALLQDVSGKKFRRIAFTVGCFAASARHARLLGTRRGRPLLYREHTYFTEDDVPLIHGITCYRGDLYRFHFETGGRPPSESMGFAAMQPNAGPGVWLRA